MSQFQQKQLAAAQSTVARSFQETNVHLFCEQGDLAEVRKAIEEKGEIVDKRDTRLQTPLHCACTGGHAQAMQVASYLLSKGADAEAKDGQLVTPLHCAAAGGNAECCKMLIAKGAVVNARDDKSATPLHWACQRGHMDCVTLLLAHGANTSAVNSKKQAPMDVIGELCYVRHDIAKAIKTKVCVVRRGVYMRHTSMWVLHTVLVFPSIH
ncbi:ankyrin repeat-containing domain protein [Tribonema minus]|uniref:Ankyrin repeat-containing domain protein n=1 Tax=Tribonema minus TaxID=303371 RepID=A0A836C7D2_9STRA|nr:ankyrin repeat-containing domain protein [Tribonema minus]